MMALGVATIGRLSYVFLPLFRRWFHYTFSMLTIIMTRIHEESEVIKG